MTSKIQDAPRALRRYAQYAEVKQIVDRISLAQRGGALKAITILSEDAGEGKTFFASAIATAYAQLTRRKVLVVDTVTFNRPGSLTLDQTLEPDELQTDKKGAGTLIVNVDLLRFTGSEYELTELIENQSKNYSLILFDTCALGARNRRNVDPLLVARQSGAAVFVISEKRRTRSALAKLEAHIQQEEIPVYGIVGNLGVVADA